MVAHEVVLPTPGMPRSLEGEAERLAAKMLKQAGVSNSAASSMGLGSVTFGGGGAVAGCHHTRGWPACKATVICQLHTDCFQAR
jgi:hypothetical protein